MENLKEQRGTKGEWIWVFVLRLIGFVMFIAPVYKPILSYFTTDAENMPITNGGVWFSLFGLFIAYGGKAVGVAINNLGVLFTEFLKRLMNI